jgi:preprotein translocase subunit SecY
MAGEAGSFMLGKTVGPAGGADMGQVGAPRGVGGGRFVWMGAGLELLVFSLPSSSLHSQLRSDRAVDGALSIWSPFSFSESSVSVEALLGLLSLLSLLRALLVLLVVLVLLARFKVDLPVCGGEARHGEISDMPLRKSR